MKCDDNEKCLKLLQLVLDGQASESDTKEFMAHLDKCMACYNEFNLNKSIKEAVIQKVNKPSMPTELVDQINSKIAEVA
jgi:anti-sigma factor (TIGR02949 family)